MVKCGCSDEGRRFSECSPILKGCTCQQFLKPILVQIHEQIILYTVTYAVRLGTVIKFARHSFNWHHHFESSVASLVRDSALKAQLRATLLCSLVQRNP